MIMIKLLYTLGFYLSIPFVLLRLWIRSFKNPDYRHRWAERFGFLKSIALKKSIWIHAVSLGESIAATPLIKALQAQYPTLPLVVTTTTPTGSAYLQKQFKNSITQVYLPLDIPSFINRFFNATNPLVCIIMETERWPNLFFCCKKRQIPVLIANARISEYSYQRYRWIQFFMKSILNNVTQLIVQSPEDGERYVKLGLDPQKLTIGGNIKFDQVLPENLMKKAPLSTAQWNVQHRKIWMAASTHEGEEEIILAAHQKIKFLLSDVLLILVPRHIERLAALIQLCEKNQFHFIQHSQAKPVNDSISVILGDTMGEMMLFYATSDVAFVGG